MIQELLAERKTSSIPNFPCSSPSLLNNSSPNCPPPTTTTTTTTPTTTSPILTPASNNATSSAPPKPSSENLRCPRCDSTNTKFCYYNNYNLTQPRHFCKTCRRYWTKGGTLRNVPIGGGCRKNKTTIGVGSGSTTSGISLAKSSASSTNAAAMAKLAKASLSTEMLLGGAPGLFGPNGLLLDHHLGPHSNPYSELHPGSNMTPPHLWGSVPQGQSSHILALLRGGNPFTNPNPNPNPNSNPSETQGSNVSVFHPVKTEGGNTGLGLDPYGNEAPSILGSFLRGNPHQVNGFGLGCSPDDVQTGGNSGSNILELYHRLKSSSNYNYCGDEISGASLMLGNMMGSSNSSSSSPSVSAMNSPFLEAANAGENLGGYNGFMSSPGIPGWSDFPTVPINGAFP